MTCKAVFSLLNRLEVLMSVVVQRLDEKALGVLIHPLGAFEKGLLERRHDVLDGVLGHLGEALSVVLGLHESGLGLVTKRDFLRDLRVKRCKLCSQSVVHIFA
jgi:hypothetical protein